jgi:hypothetical protein
MQRFNVPCHVCGFELGTNKEKCGAKAGGKKHPRPPCVWAESDNTIVLACQKKDREKKAAQQEAQLIYQRQQEQYKSGNLLSKTHTFTEGRSSSDDDGVFESAPQRSRSNEGNKAKKHTGQQVTATETAKEAGGTMQVTQEEPGATESHHDEAQDDAWTLKQQQAKEKGDIENEEMVGGEDDESKKNHERQARGNAVDQPMVLKKKEQDKEDSRMVWTHDAKCTLYKWVIKLNPFACKRGQTDAAWIDVARSCADSTKHVERQKGKIDVSGHGLQVYVGHQMKLMRAKASKETTESGQTGQLSNFEREELDLLQQIYDRKKSIVDSKDAEKGERELLDNIKAGQLGEAIYKKAMLKEPIKNKYIRNLNRKRKTVQTRYEAIKEANRSCNDEQCLAKLSTEDRDVLVLWARAKAEGHAATTGKEGSDSDSGDEDRRGGKGGRKKTAVVDAIADVSGVGPMMLQAMQQITPLEQQMTEYYRIKACAAQAPAEGVPAPLRSIADRLDRLKAAKDAEVITEAEYSAQRERIIKDAF